MTTSPTPQLSFTEALKKVFVENYCNFKGRARRSEYWWAQLGISIGAIVFYVIAMIGAFMKIQHWPGGNIVAIFGFAVYGIYCLAIFLPSLGAMVRRLHDVGKSGKMIPYLYLAYIPLMIFAILLQTTNKMWLLIPYILIVLAIMGYAIYLLVLYCKDSEPGPNKWGESPKYPDSINN